MVQKSWNKNSNSNMGNLKNTLIYYYNILVNGKHVETNLLGWRTALAHARTHTGDLFGKQIVEILNINTGEIITIEEAEIKAKRH